MLDLRFLARRKALSAIAVLTMALALGANTATGRVWRRPDADYAEQFA